jgi:hypothetical protein
MTKFTLADCTRLSKVSHIISTICHVIAKQEKQWSTIYYPTYSLLRLELEY